MLNLYVNDMMKVVDESVDKYLTGAQDKPTMVARTVESINKKILGDTADLIKEIGDLTKTIKDQVNDLNANDDLLLDTWEKRIYYI